MADDPSLVFSISHTTRNPRPGEENGREYYFVSEAEFKQKVSENFFLEWAVVHGPHYGTSRKEIERLAGSGKRIVLDIDVQGSLILQESVKALYIFITVESVEVLRERLLRRATDSADVMKSRLADATWELEQGRKWPFVVVNDDLENALKDLKQIIYGTQG